MMKLQVTKQNRKWLHLGFALEFILIGLFLTQQSKAQSQEQIISQFCAKVVGIPYQSDNFTQEEYKRFLYCKNTLSKN